MYLVKTLANLDLSLRGLGCIIVELPLSLRKFNEVDFLFKKLKSIEL